jgi:hypothetical protein
MFQQLPPSSVLPGRGMRRQRGIACVEFAMFGMVLVILLTFPLFFSRYFMHYSVAQKAARDAAVYMARVPRADMRDHDVTMAAAALASEIVKAETAGLRPGKNYTPDVDVLCDNGPCGDGPPDTIQVHVRMIMYDDFFWRATTKLIGKDGMRNRAVVSMQYIGQ